MRSFLVLTILAATLGGCRFLDADEVDAPYFSVAVGDAELSGTSIGRLSSGELHVWGQFVHPDSTFRFVQFTVPGFEGEGTYSIPQHDGTYGAILADDALDRYGFSSGLSDDLVEIEGYDSDAGIVRGTVFFYSDALVGFDGFDRGEIFSVSGRFRAELQ